MFHLGDILFELTMHVSFNDWPCHSHRPARYGSGDVEEGLAKFDAPWTINPTVSSFRGPIQGNQVETGETDCRAST